MRRPQVHAPVVTQDMITTGLRKLGVRSDDVLIAHSSLRSFGWVEGGEDAVIEGLLAAVGPSGTLCMPALSYGDYGPRRPPPLFDPDNTPSIVGRIPARFWQRSDVTRSLHPTHSVSALGPQAGELLSMHHRSETPCGWKNSPWGRIAAAGGRVAMLGVGLHYCTMLHGAEEEAEPGARCTSPVRCRIVMGGAEHIAWLRLHRPYRGALSNRARLESLLEAEGLLRRCQVGNCSLLLIEARGLWELGLRLLRGQPARTIDILWAGARHSLRRALPASVVSLCHRSARLSGR
jgi:aminoglycoside 3-N-acetyltransferase